MKKMCKQEDEHEQSNVSIWLLLNILLDIRMYGGTLGKGIINQKITVSVSVQRSTTNAIFTASM